jgi:ubiquinone/menaquinone biosynthesis C-methylase UbiE
MPKSNTEWKMWGKTDPLWAVAAWEGKSKGGANPWTDKEFYDLGVRDWGDFVARWEKFGLDREAGLEIGCGAGRLTAPMARYFGRLHALDVSEEMVEYARGHVSDGNVSFHVVDGTSIPLPDASVTGVFSTHVFQHLDSIEDATSYFGEISRVLRKGGSMMIHLPILGWPAGAPRWLRFPFYMRNQLQQLRRALQRRAITKGRFVPLMVMRSYPLGYLFHTLQDCGCSEIQVLSFLTTSNNAPHSFVMARKSA